MTVEETQAGAPALRANTASGRSSVCLGSGPPSPETQRTKDYVWPEAGKSPSTRVGDWIWAALLMNANEVIKTQIIDMGLCFDAFLHQAATPALDGFINTPSSSLALNVISAKAG